MAAEKTKSKTTEEAQAEIQEDIIICVSGLAILRKSGPNWKWEKPEVLHRPEDDDDEGGGGVWAEELKTL